MLNTLGAFSSSLQMTGFAYRFHHSLFSPFSYSSLFPAHVLICFPHSASPDFPTNFCALLYYTPLSLECPFLLSLVLRSWV